MHACVSRRVSTFMLVASLSGLTACVAGGNHGLLHGRLRCGGSAEAFGDDDADHRQICSVVGMDVERGGKGGGVLVTCF